MLTHSVADYPSHVIQLVYKPKEHTIFIAIANDLISQEYVNKRKSIFKDRIDKNKANYKNE